MQSLSRLLRHSLFLGAAIVLPLNLFSQDAAGKRAGLGVSISSESKAVDTWTTPNVWFYVPAGKSPTPFLPAEKFTAVWTGNIAVDLRGDYAFQAELNGVLKLEINGKTVLDVATNGTTEASQSIRLGKGATNTIVATFTSPSQGDAFVRLSWKPRDGFFQPIPQAALTHAVADQEKAADKLRLGRALVLEHRCARCHIEAGSSNPELAMDAPTFENIGARRNYEWMARWIHNPKSLRPDALMPAVLHGEKAKADAEAIAAYLSTLKPADLKPAVNNAAKDSADAGKKLFETLHCGACHDAPDGAEKTANKVSLKQVAAKFVPGTLTEFLKQPDAHYAWIRMPRFQLTDTQRDQLAAYLLANADAPSAVAAPTDNRLVQRGKELVQNSGCLNCHNGPAENRFTTKPLADLAGERLNAGCLAAESQSKAPRFGFSPEQNEAIRAFLTTSKPALARHVPTDFAERHVQDLNCTACHGKFDGVPAMDIFGSKLKPEWMARFIGGESNQKPRPWLDAQMPAFPKYAVDLAQGSTMQHGLPPVTPAEPASDPEMVKVGHNLVSNPPLGFACVSCHSVGSFGATQVFEAPGINLAQSGERLQAGYFKRWLRNPPMVDPQTKMPAYFDEEGRSPIADVYEGDGLKQIDALWQYIRLGQNMPAPKTE